MRPLLVFTALLSLAGCSSWQPDAEDIEPVPAERVLAYQQPLENGGEVVVTRDFGLRGGGCIAVLDRSPAGGTHPCRRGGAFPGAGWRADRQHRHRSAG